MARRWRGAEVAAERAGDDPEDRLSGVVATLTAEYGHAVASADLDEVVRAAAAVLLGQVPVAALPELTYRLAAHQLDAVLRGGAAGPA